MFLDVYKLARQVSEKTGGAFDITVAPLVNAWGFGFRNEQMPDSRQVDSLRQLVGYQHLALKGQELLMNRPGMMLDFSAIAKGYGVDVVAQVLKQQGITNYMVEIGGEIITHGISPRRLPWRVGVIKPTDDSLSVHNEYQTILNVTDKAMATSGNYRNFYYKGGKRYAHTIDPHTGYPVQHNILSATVLAGDCATADAYATSFMVMGLEGAQRILERHPELMAYLIYTDKNNEYAVWFSPSLKDKIKP
jgi:thiamine biosynthesis lipoprotein